MSYAVSKKVEKINVDILVKLVEDLNRDLKEVYEMADEESMSKERMNPVGFETQSNNKGKSSLDWNEIMHPKTNNDNTHFKNF